WKRPKKQVSIAPGKELDVDGHLVKNDKKVAISVLAPDLTVKAPTISVPDDEAEHPLITIDNPACIIPVDAVAVTEEKHKALMAAQGEGFGIVADKNGNPTAKKH